MYCISATLKGIPTDCESNLGGIQKVFIANYEDDIFTISADVVSDLSSAVTWYEYNFRPESSSFTSTLQKNENGGNYVTTEISLSFARMDTQKRIELNAMALNDMTVIVLDNNQKFWYFGMNRPVVSSTGTGESGQAFGDGNRYTVTLNATDGKFAPELSDEAIAVLKAHIYSNN